MFDINTFAAAVVAATRAFGDTRPWWRGHRDAKWPLVPSVYRKGFERKESSLAQRFRLMARSRSSSCPAADDTFDWLFLMQHYRLPTRLLDWSQSPLVALYFALEEPDDRDAAVWALCPTQLNVAQGTAERICSPGSDTLGHLGLQAFRPNKSAQDQRVLALLTAEFDVRHMVQQSAFTIHGRSEPIDKMPDCNRFLMLLHIPAAEKKGLRQLLTLFGINRASLFPDLENLAGELCSLEFQELLVVENDAAGKLRVSP